MVRDVKFLSDEFNTVRILAQVEGGQEKSVQTDDYEPAVEMQADSSETSTAQTSSMQTKAAQTPAAKIRTRRPTGLADIDEENILETRLRDRNSSLVAMALIAMDEEPQTYREAIESSCRDKWTQARRNVQPGGAIRFDSHIVKRCSGEETKNATV